MRQLYDTTPHYITNKTEGIEGSGAKIDLQDYNRFIAFKKKNTSDNVVPKN